MSRSMQRLLVARDMVNEISGFRRSMHRLLVARDIDK